MLKKVCIVLWMLIAIHVVSAQKMGATNQKKIEAEIEKIRKEWKVNGLSVAVVYKDSVIFVQGFGHSDVSKKESVNEHTLFPIGSCTKAFTCALLGKLEEQKRIDLRKSPSEYLPTLRFFNDEMNATIQVRDLMTHHTGLPRHDYSWIAFPSHNRDTMLHRIRFMEPAARPREKFIYNNIMYMVQGMIAEKLTGKSWEENIREEFFKPLGMTRSVIGDEVYAMKNVSHGFRSYLNADDEARREIYYAMAPAGDIVSSVHDMSKWVKIWLKEGDCSGNSILPKAFVNAAMSAQVVENKNVFDPAHPDVYYSNYGYGWSVYSHKSHFCFTHGGNMNGFTADIRLFPADDLGIIVLSNQESSGAATAITLTMADAVLGLKEENWSTPFLKNWYSGSEDEVTEVLNPGAPSHILDSYTGKFLHEAYGKVKIYKMNDSLWLETDVMKAWLRHRNFDVYEIHICEGNKIDTSNTNSLLVTFHSGESGRIESAEVKLEPELSPIRFRRVVK